MDISKSSFLGGLGTSFELILKCSGKVNVALYLGVDFLKMFIVTVFLVKNSWILKLRNLEALGFVINLY